MISYEPLWITMKEKNITTYYLRNKGKQFNISGSTICRLKSGQSVSTQTIDNLCKLLECDIVDIIKYIKD